MSSNRLKLLSPSYNKYTNDVEKEYLYSFILFFVEVPADHIASSVVTSNYVNKILLLIVIYLLHILSSLLV